MVERQIVNALGHNARVTTTRREVAAHDASTRERLKDHVSSKHKFQSDLTEKLPVNTAARRLMTVPSSSASLKETLSVIDKELEEATRSAADAAVELASSSRVSPEYRSRRGEKRRRSHSRQNGTSSRLSCSRERRGAPEKRMMQNKSALFTNGDAARPSQRRQPYQLFHDEEVVDEQQLTKAALQKQDFEKETLKIAVSRKQLDVRKRFARREQAIDEQAEQCVAR